MHSALHINYASTFRRHQDNIMASLAHRIEAARAANDRTLIELLEQEKQQITATAEVESPSLAGWLKACGQRFINALGSQSRLQVSHYVNGSDRWWYAFNPQTGECVYADSEAELKLWIKENYRGR